MITGALILAGLGVVGSFLGWLRFRFCLKGDRVLVRSGVQVLATSRQPLEIAPEEVLT